MLHFQVPDGRVVLSWPDTDGYTLVWKENRDRAEVDEGAAEVLHLMWDQVNTSVQCDEAIPHSTIPDAISESVTGMDSRDLESSSDQAFSEVLHVQHQIQIDLDWTVIMAQRTVPAPQLLPGDTLTSGVMVTEIYDDGSLDETSVWIEFDDGDCGYISRSRRFTIEF